MARHFRTDASLPWPECLGTFDEESCRYFLRQLGQRMVQFYPFSVGIEEVYSHIVDEYGLDGAPDAMSVLQELLEDDSAAAGVGDDGDIWRSWRHSWRHRNDNVMNPYVPRVRGRILGPPTTVRIRLLKSANFITAQLNQAKDCANRSRMSQLESCRSWRLSNASLDLLGPSQSCTSQESDGLITDHHELSSDANVRKHDPRISSDSSQQDTRDVTDQKFLLPAQRYDSGTSTSLSCSSQILTTDRPRKYPFPFSFASPRRRAGTLSPRFDQYGPCSVDVIPEEESGDSVPAKIVSPLKSPAVSALCGDRASGPKQTLSSMQTGGDKNNRYSLPSELGPLDRDATPTRRRAIHRQARMIDGALFQGKSRKGKFIESGGIAAGSPVKQKSENENKRLHGQSTKQHCRGSWLHNVLTRFRGDHHRNSTQPKLRKRHSSLTSCGIVGSPRSDDSSAFRTNTSPITEMKQTTPTSRLGFDGTVEDHNNKPLPLSPGELPRPSMQSDIQRTFFGRSSNPVLLSPNASVSTTAQKSHSLHKSSDLAPLVSATMSGPHELSPKEKAWKYQLSTSTTRSEAQSPSSFSNIANKNPYHDFSEPSTPTIPTPAPLIYHKQKISSNEWPFRAPQDLQFHRVVEQSQHNKTGSCHSDNGSKPLTSEALAALHAENERGRRTVAPAAPAVAMDVEAHVAALTTPPPRSRSPVKRLIGMVKSMSTNQMSENTPPSMQNTPNSTNKRKWKELSNKLRHGFLTADLEQLEQEEMMEQYSTNNDVQILTPPPSRQRSSFPVSIKSSGQSKLWSELEYMLIETCNTFLKEELANDRISRDSVIRAKRQWQSRSRPPIIEFYYDQATQYEIIIGNLRTIKLYSDYAEDAIILNSVLHQWKILIRELSVKTLCMPDSIVRRWLHDGRRVLELLGAPQITLAHLDRLSGLCFAVFGSAEKQRAKQRGRADTTNSHRRSASDGSQNTLYIHEQALMNNGTPGNVQVPPLPTHRSMGNVTRKVTPLEQRLTQQARKSMEKDRFVFTSGQPFSKSFTPTEEKGRFALD